MYDVAHAGKGDCVSDPEYNVNMCGFADRPGCLPLNGCGSDAIYLYLYSFIMVAFFVSLNLFVGVILDAFQNANEVLTPSLLLSCYFNILYVFTFRFSI